MEKIIKVIERNDEAVHCLVSRIVVKSEDPSRSTNGGMYNEAVSLYYITTVEKPRTFVVLYDRCFNSDFKCFRIIKVTDNLLEAVEIFKEEIKKR